MKLLIPEFGLLIWNLVAFLIAFFILAKFAWPGIINGLKTREQSIAESLSTAEKVKAEMAQMKSENEALLMQAREERASMIKEAKETRDKMIQDAKEEAGSLKAKLLSEAEMEINNKKMAAIVDLKNQVGNLVIEVSEKVLRRELQNKADQENYVKQLSEEIRLN
jgi:F-type H+-transporting ATPase subunit b